MRNLARKFLAAFLLILISSSAYAGIIVDVVPGGGGGIGIWIDDGTNYFTAGTPRNIWIPDDMGYNAGGSVGAPKARSLWEKADANANAYLVVLPEGGATDVPVFMVGDETALNLDLGLFDGITNPTIAVLSDDATKAGVLFHDGTDFNIKSTSGNILFDLDGSTDQVIIQNLNDPADMAFEVIGNTMAPDTTLASMSGVWGNVDTGALNAVFLISATSQGMTTATNAIAGMTSIIITDALDQAGTALSSYVASMQDNGGSALPTAFLQAEDTFTYTVAAIDSKVIIAPIITGAGDPAYSVEVQQPKIQTAAANQTAFFVSQELDDSGATAFDYTLIGGKATITDVSGWDSGNEVGLINVLAYDSGLESGLFVGIYGNAELYFADEGTQGASIRLLKETTTPAGADNVSVIKSESQNDNAPQDNVVYGAISTEINSPATGSEEGIASWGVMDSTRADLGTPSPYITLDGGSEKVLVSKDLEVDGGWISHDTSNLLYGTQSATHVNLGIASTTGTNGQDYQYATVGGGEDNVAAQLRSTVVGGEANTASEEGATVLGGWNNVASGLYSVVGGFNSTAAGDYSAVFGRFMQPTSAADYTFVFGYATDTASAFQPTDLKSFIFYQDDDGAIGSNVIYQHGSDSLADGDPLGTQNWRGSDDDAGSVPVLYGRDIVEIQDPTPGSEEAIRRMSVVEAAGVITEYLRLDGTDGITAVSVLKTLDPQAAQRAHRTAVGAVNYNPSALTTDYIIAMTDTSAPRSVIISTEDVISGTSAQPRVMEVKDEGGQAGANTITITLESGGTIDGAANAQIISNYGSVTIYIDGTNAWIR